MTPCGWQEGNVVTGIMIAKVQGNNRWRATALFSIAPPYGQTNDGRPRAVPARLPSPPLLPSPPPVHPLQEPLPPPPAATPTVMPRGGRGGRGRGGRGTGVVVAPPIAVAGSAAAVVATDDLSERLGLQRDGTIIDRLATLGYERSRAALAMAALRLPLLSYEERHLSEAVVYLETALKVEDGPAPPPAPSPAKVAAQVAVEVERASAARLVRVQRSQAELEQHHLGWALLEIDLNALSLQIRAAEAAGVDSVAPEALHSAKARSSLA